MSDSCDFGEVEGLEDVVGRRGPVGCSQTTSSTKRLIPNARRIHDHFIANLQCQVGDCHRDPCRGSVWLNSIVVAGQDLQALVSHAEAWALFDSTTENVGRIGGRTPHNHIRRMLYVFQHLRVRIEELLFVFAFSQSSKGLGLY